MEHKLRHLYTLQLIDNNLDELEEMKGALPRQVRELEARAGDLQAVITALEGTMRTAFAGRDAADSEIIGLREKLARYKTQQFEVRNNKEYDALTREMDHAQEAIVRFEKEMLDLEHRATMARSDIETRRAELDELTAALEIKRTELAEVSKETEEEELKYNHQRQKVAVKISKEDLTVYHRIRKAKKGKAVVPVKRGSCGGCFNRVPPQKLLELRQNKRIYTCERCGRILVSDEIAEKSSAAP